MLLFGHLGITIGIAWILERKFKMNYILIAIGSLLPDIIDKTVGFLFFSTGRAFAHSLLFIVLLLFLSVWKRFFIYITFASFLHLIQDEMWNSSTFYFPFSELDVKEVDLNDYVNKTFYLYFSISKTSLFEFIGVIILILFFIFKINIFRNRKRKVF